MTIDPRLNRIVSSQPYPLLFATISGAHLYGFPSPDSDFDLRGAHVLPLEKIVGLEVHDETVSDSRVIEGLEMDICSAHDLRKFFGLLLKKNGYVLEQLFSPLIVHTTPEHAELKRICNAVKSDTSPYPVEELRARKIPPSPHPSPPREGEVAKPAHVGGDYEASRTSLFWVCGDAVEAVFEGVAAPGETAAARVSRAAHAPAFT